VRRPQHPSAQPMAEKTNTSLNPKPLLSMHDNRRN
jgi:hypothetical protein